MLNNLVEMKVGKMSFSLVCEVAKEFSTSNVLNRRAKEENN